MGSYTEKNPKTMDLLNPLRHLVEVKKEGG